MEHVDLLVTGGLLVSGLNVEQGDVAIRDGVVVGTGRLEGVRAEKVIDAGDCYVLPGIIDVHTHPVYADDLDATCRAGSSGGVTTVISYIGAFPSWGFEKKQPLEIAREYIREWDGRPACDFGLHMAIDNTDDLKSNVDGLAQLGIRSFKFFMSYRTRGMMVTDETLIRNFEIVAKSGGIAAVHAENGAGVSYMEERYWDKDYVDPGVFHDCHTELFEGEAILRAVALADAVACPLYVPHVTVSEALDVLRMARHTSSIPIWAETCPHYLLLTNDDVLRKGSLAKIAPPLRSEQDNERLWAAIASGEVSTIASDHAGRTLAMKAQGKNLLQQPYGTEGIEHLLPIAYSDGVAQGRFSITQLVEALSERPADIFGLSPKKGRLLPGADGDLVVFDPRPGGFLAASEHRGNSDYCLYEGHPTIGKVLHTVRRGQVVHGAVDVDGPFGGAYVPRAGYRRESRVSVLARGAAHGHE